MIYVIMDYSELSSVDFSLVEESSSTIRRSLDGTKFIVKYSGKDPSFVSGKTKYNHSEISAILNDYDEGWNEQDPQ